MDEIELTTRCTKCRKKALVLKVEEAAHDSQLIDLVIECSKCKHWVSAFVPLADFMECK